MNNYFLVLVFVLLIMGCNTSNLRNDVYVDTVSVNGCDHPVLKQVYFDKGCNNQICGFHHYLMLNKYLDSCFNDYDFISIADKYLDTVKNNVPVKSIQFIRPFTFNPEFDSKDYESLYNNSIINIGFSDSTLTDEIPAITRISIWTNGKEKTIHYIDVLSRSNKYKNKRN